MDEDETGGPWQPSDSAFPSLDDELQDFHIDIPSPLPRHLADYHLDDDHLQGMETPYSLISGYPSRSSGVPTLSSNSNPSVFSGSSRSSASSARGPYGISTRRAHQKFRPPNSASSRLSSHAFNSLHDDNHQMPTHQLGIVPEMGFEHAAGSHPFHALGRSLQTMGTDLLFGRSVLSPQLQNLRIEMQKVLGLVENLIHATSPDISSVQNQRGIYAPVTSTASNRPAIFRCWPCYKNGVESTSYESRPVFKRHLSTQHFGPSHEYHCPEIGCDKLYQTPDELATHFDLNHNRTLQQKVLDKCAIGIRHPPQCVICSNTVCGWDEFYQCVMKHCLVSPIRSGNESSLRNEDFDPFPMTYLQEDKNEPPPEPSGIHSAEIDPFEAMEPIDEYLWSQTPPEDREVHQFMSSSEALAGIRAIFWKGEIPQSLPKSLRDDTKLDLSEPPPMFLRKDSGIQQPERSIPKPVDSNTSKSSQPSDDDESHSMQTNITRPDQEDEFDLDTGIADNEDMEHILNPSAYYRKLDLLERRTAEICGVAGPEVKQKSAHECKESLQKSRDALQNLMQEGFCGNAMSILVRDQSRPDVAKAVRISLDDIKSVLIWFSTSSLRRKVRLLTLIPVWLRLRDLLGPLPDSSARSEMAVARLEDLQFFTEALSIGLVSFSGSHVCRFDENLWGEDKSTISIGRGYSFALRDLACLKDFVGGPAWVLGKDQPEVPTTGLKVSLTVEDLQQLWGPVWLMGGPGDEGVFIRTEAGYIIPLPRHMQSDQSLEEIECHWSSSYTGYETDNPIQLRSSSRILIGTEPCTKSGLNINEGCRAQIKFLQARILPQLQPSGAHNAYHTLEGWDLTMQATLGSYVQAGGALKWKRNPARKWKTSIIEKCKYGKPNLRSLLSCNIGLEVSACTGNAHRVTLWDALRLSQTTAKTDQEPFSQHTESPPCRHRIADPDCIKSCWTRLFSTDDIDSSVNIPPEGDPKRKEYLRRIIMNSIIALEDTGVDDDNNLQAYWPFTENARTHRIELSPVSGGFNNWIRVIKDSRDVATFAVASQRCMEVYHGHERRCTMPCQVGHHIRQKTTLYTRILLNPPSTCTENHDCHMRDSSMENEVDKLVPNEHFVLGEAALTVQSIVSGNEMVIVATASGSAVKNGWMKLVKLNRRKMFQEDLDLDLSTGYYFPLLIH